MRAYEPRRKIIPVTGELLGRALAMAGIAPADAYVQCAAPPDDWTGPPGVIDLCVTSDTFLEVAEGCRPPRAGPEENIKTPLWIAPPALRGPATLIQHNRTIEQFGEGTFGEMVTVRDVTTFGVRRAPAPPLVVSVPIMSASPGATGTISVTDGTGTRTAKIEDGKVGAFTTVAQKGWTNIGSAEKTLETKPCVAPDGVKIANLPFAAYFEAATGRPLNDGVAYTTADGKTRAVTPTYAEFANPTLGEPFPPTLKRPCTACNLAEAIYFPVYSGALCHACARAKLPPLEAAPRRWPKIVAAVVGAAAAVGGVVAAWGGLLP